MTPDAPRPDLDEAERACRVLGKRGHLAVLLAEYDRRGAALAEHNAEVARLRAAVERMREDAVAVVRYAFRDYHEREDPKFTLFENVAAFLRDPDEWDTDDGLSAAALAAAPAPAEDDDDDGHGPWLYTEYGVECSCRYPVDADERCTRPRDPAGQREELLGALFETADNLLEHLAQTGSVAAEDSHVYDLRHARDALAEWHAPAPAREQADPAAEEA